MSRDILTASPGREVSGRESRPAIGHSPQTASHPVLQLQQTLGNRRVGQLIQSRRLSPSGEIAAAQRTSSDGAGVAHRRPSATELLQRAAGEGHRPLDATLRRSLEQQLGHDFSQVRVHSGAASASAAEHIGARAYTLGNDIHLGAETSGMGGGDYDRLLAHEVVHTVQQGGGSVAPREGLTVSSPADAAEHEAEQIASTVTGPDVVQSPSRSLALRDRMRAGAPASGITRSVLPHLQRDLTGKKSVKDGDFDLNLTTQAPAGGPCGLSGTIAFTANEGAPDAKQIRLLQTVRNQDLGTNKEYAWSGGEAERNNMRTAANPAQGVDPGWFVDHSAAAATPRTAKTDAAVSPYYRDYWPNATQSQDGSKSGKTVAPASLWDFPQSSGNRKFSFETAAKSPDTGYVYATLTWGFTISDASKGKVDHEYATAHRGPSPTYNAAVKAFDEHYKNPGASTAP